LIGVELGVEHGYLHDVEVFTYEATREFAGLPDPRALKLSKWSRFCRSTTLAWSYEMHWVDLPPEAAAVRTAYDEFIDSLLSDEEPHDANRAREGSSLREAYEKAMEPYSCRFNIAAMARCRWLMDRFGMMVRADAIPWDDPQFAAPTLEASEELAGAQRVAGTAGIPSFKVESNGPWLVHVDEIEAALNAYDAAGKRKRQRAERDSVWQMWVEWLRETREHGGFSVS